MATSSTTPVGDDAILAELGARLVARRVDLELTQGQLAAAAGVSKRTVERLEHGGSAQLTSYVRVLRQLGLLDAWLAAHPAVGPRPSDVLAAQRRQAGRPKRVRVRKPVADSADWRWGDEE